eukprot:GHVQ01006521.1.p1 GENE.GHVQ01006521.1~~GHVQ01006521.1.p1  ORF type:complete len:138 (-),score=38.98 GHVQ01006521.1:306-719(-)
MRRMFMRFFPKDESLVQDFVEALKGMQISMAELQGFFMFCKASAERSVEMAKQWRDSERQAYEKHLNQSSYGIDRTCDTAQHHATYPQQTNIQEEEEDDSRTCAQETNNTTIAAQSETTDSCISSTSSSNSIGSRNT